MSIAKQIALRYRARGHLRFSLPAELCQPHNAERLIAGLKKGRGVYRVDLYRLQRKLSIRYIAEVCDDKAVASTLHAVSLEIESHPTTIAHTGSLSIPPEKRPDRAGLSTWAKQKYQELKETATALSIVARNTFTQQTPNSTIAKKYISEFFTDALVIYLIKLHWHMITQHWIRRPWQYRYEWLAVLYMISLLVGSKRPKP